MTEVQINAIADQIFAILVEQYDERGLDGDMTMITSVAWTCQNTGVLKGYNLGLEPDSPEDKMLTEFVNARIEAFNETRNNSQSLQ